MTDSNIKKGKKKGKVIAIVLNVIIVLLVAFAISQIIFYTKYTSVYVVGSSMQPTLTGAVEDSLTKEIYRGGDYVYVEKNKTPTYGDIVVLRVSSSKLIIKRVIAMGGDSVELINGQVFLNGECVVEDYVAKENNTPSKNNYDLITVEEGKIFVLGDNRNNSNDSRLIVSGNTTTGYGTIELSQVLGVVPEWSLKNKQSITNWNTFINFDIKKGIFGININ